MCKFECKDVRQKTNANRRMDINQYLLSVAISSFPSERKINHLNRIKRKLKIWRRASIDVMCSIGNLSNGNEPLNQEFKEALKKRNESIRKLEVDPDSFLLEWLPIVRALPSRGIISKEKCYNGFVQDALDIIKIEDEFASECFEAYSDNSELTEITNQRNFQGSAIDMD